MLISGKKLLMEQFPLTLVLGASENPSRYANRAIHQLSEKGYPVLGVGLREGNVAGVPIQTAIPMDVAVDTVTLYVGPSNLNAWLPDLLAIKPRRVIFNPGTENPQVYPTLKAAGIQYEEACTLVLLRIDAYWHQ
jgi:predicted CoA-binding protein